MNEYGKHRGRAQAYAALDNGFKRAYSTIVDANVTSLIATSLLFRSARPVRGFAITMFLERACRCSPRSPSYAS